MVPVRSGTALQGYATEVSECSSTVCVQTILQYLHEPEMAAEGAIRGPNLAYPEQSVAASNAVTSSSRAAIGAAIGAADGFRPLDFRTIIPIF